MFTPQRLNANIGDQIIFEFHALNHTLTQSSLERPCASLQQFDTGFNQFNPQSKENVVTVITVNSLEPQWFFCRQNRPTSHCHMGMVFAINPGDQMDTFLQNAHGQRIGETSRLASTTKSILRSSGSGQYGHINPTTSPVDPSHACVSKSVPSRSVESANDVFANPISSSSPVPKSIIQGSSSSSQYDHISPTTSPVDPSHARVSKSIPSRSVGSAGPVSANHSPSSLSMSLVVVTKTEMQDCGFLSGSATPGHSPTPLTSNTSFWRNISRSNMTSEGNGFAIIPSLISLFSVLLIAAFL